MRSEGISRVRLSLNGAWEFIPDPKNEFSHDRLPATGHRIEVPGSWEQVFPGGEGVLGRGWYRRTVEIPAHWEGKAVFLRFGAVNYYCQVWVNGDLAGDHEGGYTPFSIRVDPYLRPGQPNTFVVKVVHPGPTIPSFRDFSYRDVRATLQDMFGYPVGEIPIGKQNWYGSVSGI